MITVRAAQRVAEGGICNSGAAVDLARVTITALRLCTHTSAVMADLKNPESVSFGRTYNAVEVHNILANMLGALDHACADAIDTGDGRTIKQVYDEDKAREAGLAGEDA